MQQLVREYKTETHGTDRIDTWTILFKQNLCLLRTVNAERNPTSLTGDMIESVVAISTPSKHHRYPVTPFSSKSARHRWEKANDQYTRGWNCWSSWQRWNHYRGLIFAHIVITSCLQGGNLTTTTVSSVVVWFIMHRDGGVYPPCNIHQTSSVSLQI